MKLVVDSKHNKKRMMTSGKSESDVMAGTYDIYYIFQFHKIWSLAKVEFQH